MVNISVGLSREAGATAPESGLYPAELARQCDLHRHLPVPATDPQVASDKLCGETYANQSRLNRHIRAAHQGKKMEQLLQTAEAQQMITSAEKPYKCSLCKQRFTLKYSVVRHKRRKHREVFSSINNHPINNHPINNHPINNHPCHLKASKGVKRMSGSRNRKQSDERKFPCEICGKEFAKRRYTYQHVRKVHKGKKIGGLKITARPRENRPKQHKVLQKSDPHDKGFKCKFCDASYSRKTNLRKHIVRDHQGTGLTHVCKLCGAGFYNSTSVNKHMASVHIELPQNSCSVCKQVFTTFVSLTRHEISVHHKTRMSVCGLCGETFQTKTVTLRHLHRIHKCFLKMAQPLSTSALYTCQACSKDFPTKNSRSQHNCSQQVCYKDS